MIAPVSTSSSTSTSATSPEPSWQEKFLAILPAIERQATFALRHLSGEALEDAVAEVVANCTCAFRRLHEKGRLHVAFASALVRFAVAQFHDGRRVGSRQNSHDVYDLLARREGRYRLCSLNAAHQHGAVWAEAVIDNRRSPVPEQVSFRIDFPEWLAEQGTRKREIAERLSLGCSTSEVASEFEVSRARISQLRREFEDSWNEFSADLQPPEEECEESFLAVA